MMILSFSKSHIKTNDLGKDKSTLNGTMRTVVRRQHFRRIRQWRNGGSFFQRRSGTSLLEKVVEGDDRLDVECVRVVVKSTVQYPHNSIHNNTYGDNELQLHQAKENMCIIRQKTYHSACSLRSLRPLRLNT